MRADQHGARLSPSLPIPRPIARLSCACRRSRRTRDQRAAKLHKLTLCIAVSPLTARPRDQSGSRRPSWRIPARRSSLTIIRCAIRHRVPTMSPWRGGSPRLANYSASRSSITPSSETIALAVCGNSAHCRGRHVLVSAPRTRESRPSARPGAAPQDKGDSDQRRRATSALRRLSRRARPC
jgi:hypothetical protein